MLLIAKALYTEKQACLQDAVANWKDIQTTKE
jgi:hypothetical protein